MNRLEYILAVIEEKNITKAAKRLYITQPTLTKYINQLEDEYGVKFFDRSTTPIRLTEAGQLYVEKKKMMIEEERSLRSQLKSIEDKKITLTIGSGHTRGEKFLPYALKQFCDLHSNVDFCITFPDEIDFYKKLKSGAIDLAFGVIDVTNNMDIEYLEMTVESMGIVVPTEWGFLPQDADPSLTFQHPLPITADMLNGRDVIIPGRSTGADITFMEMLSKYNIQFGRVITANNMIILRELIQYGLGYSFISVNKQIPRNCILCSMPGISSKRSGRCAYIRSHPHVELLRELSGMIFQSIKLLG